MVVPSVEFNKSDIKGFDSSSSTSFSEIGRIDSFSLEKIYKAIIGQDTIKIGESESINNIQFLVVSEYTFSIFNSYSFIGLDFDTITSNFKNLNLLGQLKNNSIIEKQLWYLDFTDYNKGKFVIGKFPHEVKNETYKEKDRYTTNFVRADY